MEQELRFGLELGQMADFPAIASKPFIYDSSYNSKMFLKFATHFDVSKIYEFKKNSLNFLQA